MYNFCTFTKSFYTLSVRLVHHHHQERNFQSLDFYLTDARPQSSILVSTSDFLSTSFAFFALSPNLFAICVGDWFAGGDHPLHQFQPQKPFPDYFALFNLWDIWLDRFCTFCTSIHCFFNLCGIFVWFLKRRQAPGMTLCHQQYDNSMTLSHQDKNRRVQQLVDSTLTTRCHQAWSPKSTRGEWVVGPSILLSSANNCANFFQSKDCSGPQGGQKCQLCFLNWSPSRNKATIGLSVTRNGGHQIPILLVMAIGKPKH